jgi:hypothetical protein
MQAGHHQHMKDTGLLKIRCVGMIDKAAITQKHSAQNSGCL